MPGDVSQPGDAPRTESKPWALPEPEPTWWPPDTDPDGDEPAGSGDDPSRSRHPRRRPPQPTNVQPTNVQPTNVQPTNVQPTNAQAMNAQPANVQATETRARETQPSGGIGTLLPQREHQPPYAPETADARDTGGREVARELDPAIKQRAAEELRTEPGGVERDHNRPDPFRYDPLRPPVGYSSTAGLADGPVAETPPPQPTPQSQTHTQPAQLSEAPVPAEPRHAEPQPPEPDVMVLPEPDSRNRPTVPLGERVPAPAAAPGSVPGQGRIRPTEPLPRPTGDAATDARLQKLENSPFWLTEAERATAGRLPGVSSHTAERTRRSHRARRTANRRPAPALFALVMLALVGSFFSWVSAEPFWLAVGHGDQGYATTSACRGSGVAQRCVGRFDAADGSFAVTRVILLGVADDKRAAGAVTPARMVSAGSRTAYLGNAGLLVHLRWVLGFVLVLICGYAIAGLTGARRLDDPRTRRLTTLASLSAPLILLAGFLFAAY